MMGRSESFAQFHSIKDAEFDLRGKDMVMENYFFHSSGDNVEEAKEIKPRKTEVKKIKALLKKPNFVEMNVNSSFLFWKFRYYLSDNPEALPKFLKSVKWTNKQFLDEALQLMENWSVAKYDDALYMLSRTFSMNPEYSTDLVINADDIERVFTRIR
jgi:phosphatidylinositol 3-kinase